MMNVTDDACTRVAFIGQVDHGKSSLLARLIATAADQGQPVANMARGFCADVANGQAGELAHAVDQLVEERAGGLTIDTTEVRLMLGGRSFGLIDAPGHLELLRNMVTGTARADAAVLVLDALAGVHSQTLRHLSVATLLGCREIIVAVNKMDAVGYRPEAFEEVVKPLLATLIERDHSAGAVPAVVPLSALTGDGVRGRSEQLAWSKGPTLQEALLQLAKAPPLTELPTHFAVQDVYQRDGAVWLVGRVNSGRLERGMVLRTAHDRQPFTVTSLLRYPELVSTADAGQSIALALTSPTPGTPLQMPDRGNVLCAHDHPLVLAAAVSAHVVWLDHTPLAPGETLEIRCATQSVHAKVVGASRVHGGDAPATEAAIAYGDMAQVDLKLERPIAIGGSALRGTALGKLVALRDGRLVAGGHALC